MKIPAWAKKYPHKKFAFKNLPPEAKKAVVVYMFGARADVKEVEDEDGRSFSSIVKEFEKYNKNAPFEIVIIPTEVLAQKAIDEANVRDGANFKSPKEWHDHYVKYEELPQHKKIWPLLGGDEDEVIQDGWHRLHLYYENGVKNIPVVYFLDHVDNIFA